MLTIKRIADSNNEYTIAKKSRKMDELTRMIEDTTITEPIRVMQLVYYFQWLPVELRKLLINYCKSIMFILYQIPGFQFITEKQRKWSQGILATWAVRHNYLPLLQWVYFESHIEIKQEIWQIYLPRIAFRYNRLLILRWLYSCVKAHIHILLNYLRYDTSMESFLWLRINDVKISANRYISSLGNIVRIGNLDILKYYVYNHSELMTIKYYVHDMTILMPVIAAEYGHLHILKWYKEYDNEKFIRCITDRNITNTVCKFNYIDYTATIDWLSFNECVWVHMFQ